MTAADPVSRVLAKLGPVRRNGAGWIARCPAHEDKVPSLKVDAGDDGRALIYCHAGCSAADIADALGLPLADLFAEDADAPTRETVYPYRAEDGTTLYEVVRTDPGKRFAQRRADGEWTMQGVRRVLYRLPELIAADPAETVYVVEGEKDADRLAGLGLIATSSVGGAGKWRAEYAEPLHGRRVVILADNDDPGRAHARAVADSTGGTVVDLPGLPPKGDVSDWLDAGGTIDELRALATTASKPPQRVRLTSAASITVRPVKWVWQDRLPVGALALLAGREGIAKSTVAYTIAAELTNGHLPGVFAGVAKSVIVAATEDAWEETIVPRLMAAGADLARVYRIDAIAPDGLDAVLVLPRDIAELEAQAADVDAAMILLDPLMSRLDGRLDSHKDAEVRIALEPIVAMANRARMLVLGIIHVNKSGSTDPLSMVMGSRAFTAVSRAVLFMMLDPEDPSIRLLGQPKNNLGRTDDLPTLALRIEEAHVADTADGPVTTGKVVWLGDSPVTIDEALNPSSEATSKIDEAATAMLAILRANGGRMLARDAYAALEEAGISTKSNDRMTKARLRVGITSSHDTPTAPWYWQAPRGLDA